MLFYKLNRSSHNKSSSFIYYYQNLILHLHRAKIPIKQLHTLIYHTQGVVRNA